MRLAMMMAMQAVPVSGPPTPPDLLVTRITPRSCRQQAAADTATGDEADVVVCGRASDADRLPRIDPDRYADTPLPRAETTVVGKLRIAAEAEQGVLPNGQTSPRAMLKFKLPF